MRTSLTLIPAAFCCVILIACGGSGGVPLGDFPALSATEGDAPLTLVAPSSKSPGAFAFSSSNAQVATIAGNILTVHAAGTSTITASQPQAGSYNPTATSATLTVKARPCVAPAVSQSGVCTAPQTAGASITLAGTTWAPVTRSDTWSNANSYCGSTTINGVNGWRLPTQFELASLFESGLMNKQGWLLGVTWS